MTQYTADEPINSLLQLFSRAIARMGRRSTRMRSWFRHGDSAEAGAPEAPTKRIPRGWKCMPYIIGNETFEKVASVGLIANFTVYLVKRFNMEQVTAANMTNIFFGTTNFAPLLGAFISDAYWGRYKTLAYSSVVSFLGMVVFTLSASVPQLRPPECRPEAQLAHQCVGASGLQLGILFLSLVLLAVGAGGVRPCSLPFGVDQFDVSTEKGQRGINSFFNWYYFTSTAGIVLSLTFIVYVQNSVSWVVGFAIPTGFMLLAVVAFFLGTRLYVFVEPEGSVFTSIGRVFVAAFRKRRLRLPCPDDVRGQELLLYNPPSSSERVMKLPLTLQFRFLNKAAIMSEDALGTTDSPPHPPPPVDPWRLCSVQQIEEVKCLLRIVPIWASGITCFVALGQQFTFAILQALKMDRHLGPRFQIPAGSLGTIALLALSLFIPVYDRLLVPAMRRLTNIDSGITLLQRQGVGIVLSIFSMVVAALVERKRRNSASPLTVMWLVPQLVVMGVAEAFNAIGQIEFYNRQFPEHMQTLANSLFYCSLAGASYLSTFLVSVVQRVTATGGRTSWLDNDIDAGKVDYFYYLIAVLGGVNLVYFLVCSHFYRYKGTAGQGDYAKEEEEDAKGGGDVP